MKKINSAVNLQDSIEYFVGDRVVIYQGRFGHDNIITIKSIWDFGDWIGVTNKEEPPCTNITAIKRKIDDKEIEKIIKDKARLSYVEKYRIL